MSSTCRTTPTRRTERLPRPATLRLSDFLARSRATFATLRLSTFRPAQMEKPSTAIVGGFRFSKGFQTGSGQVPDGFSGWFRASRSRAFASIGGARALSVLRGADRFGGFRGVRSAERGANRARTPANAKTCTCNEVNISRLTMLESILRPYFIGYCVPIPQSTKTGRKSAHIRSNENAPRGIAGRVVGIGVKGNAPRKSAGRGFGLLHV